MGSRIIDDPVESGDVLRIPYWNAIERFVFNLDHLPFWKLIFVIFTSIVIGACSYLLVESLGVDFLSASHESGYLAMALTGLVSVAVACLMIRVMRRDGDVGSYAENPPTYSEENVKKFMLVRQSHSVGTNEHVRRRV